MKYTKKPVTIEAIQWHKRGDGFKIVEHLHPDMRLEELTPTKETLVVLPYTNTDVPGYYPCPVCGISLMEHGEIKTLESGGNTHVVCPGDWIIKGIEGEYYACKPSIFEKTYSKGVPDSTSPTPLIKALKEIAAKGSTWKDGIGSHLGKIASDALSNFESIQQGGKEQEEIWLEIIKDKKWSATIGYDIPYLKSKYHITLK